MGTAGARGHDQAPPVPCHTRRTDSCVNVDARRGGARPARPTTTTTRATPDDQPARPTSTTSSTAAATRTARHSCAPGITSRATALNEGLRWGPDPTRGVDATAGASRPGIDMPEAGSPTTTELDTVEVETDSPVTPAGMPISIRECMPSTPTIRDTTKAPRCRSRADSRNPVDLTGRQYVGHIRTAMRMEVFHVAVGTTTTEPHPPGWGPVGGRTGAQ
jgi:hypothetical protein